MPSITRRAFFAIVVAGSVVVACSSGSPPPPTQTTPKPQTTVHIGSFSTAIDYAPYLVAKSNGWFEEALAPFGAHPEFTTFQSLPPINEAFGTGRIDVVFEAEPPAIIGRAAGIDIRITALGCSLRQEIIVPAASKATSIRDLKGQSVAVLAGTSSHYGLLTIAEHAGLQVADITVVDLTPPDAKSAFHAGHVSAWAVWPPWVEQELAAGTGRLLEGGDAKIHSIMAMRGEFVDEAPDLARAVSGVLQRSKEWIAQHPEEAMATVAGALDLDLKVVRLAWPKHDFKALLSPAVDADIQAKADFLRQQNLIRQPVQVTDLVQPIVAAGSQ